MSHLEHNPRWAILAPFISGILLLLYWLVPGNPVTVVLVAVGLIGSVVAAVHHAEVIAFKVGEPFGTLVLALAITIIEVALIVSMMLSGGDEVMALPRDTIFAAVMIILNGIIGLSLLVGGRQHRVQTFNVEGMTDALCTTTLILVLAMVLPNYIGGVEGPVYTELQLGFIALATLVLFGSFTLFQTVLHREYFIQTTHAAPVSAGSLPPPDQKTTLVSLALLLVALVIVVLSAKTLSPTLEALLGFWGAPATALGIVIAAIVLLPEFGAAMRAASHNRLQASLNLAIGSAVASIGLTIPVVAFLAIYMGWPLELGLPPASMILLALTLFVVALTLRTGNTTLQPGVVHLVLFAAYLVFSFMA